MAKLFVICGHGAGDPGADGGGYTEAERVRALAARIKALGGSEVELGDTSRNWYRDGGISRLETTAPVVELHMDASGVPGAHGAHVIVKKGFEPDEYDRALADKLAAFMPGRAEKIVHHSELANVNRAARRGINYRLVENGFIDSEEDREKFNGHLDELARIYLEVFGITASSATSEPEAGASGSGSTGFEGGTYRCTVDTLNVRDEPGLSGSVVASYHKNQTVVLDSWYKVADGYVWGRYTGATSGKLRYVAVGRATGKPEADDYLVRVE
ncbi:N-acetylmuramoyl-L-alanine amidase [uncultured Parolsenella sp.]|uniref:N-acetylmuramoyl-L-alanine amidase n=1 Tax=uncultured Parolsenella sp. TaxID=2083008 RepID=UPI0025E96AA9|nr:N-acetylmuramoyl-L-alanine amidase [uncultured Parolsenella sp.]